MRIATSRPCAACRRPPPPLAPNSACPTACSPPGAGSNSCSAQRGAPARNGPGRFQAGAALNWNRCSRPCSLRKRKVLASRPAAPYNPQPRGAVAQLGERRVRIAKVVGSIPIRSTIPSSGNPGNPAIGGVFARSSARGASTLGREKNLLLSRPARSAQREVVGRFRIGLGPQRVVPPLVGVVGKTLSLHRVTQQMPVATLRGGHVRRVGVRQFAEVVEAGAHVQRLAVPATVIALRQGQVERGTAARSEEHTSELQSLMSNSYAVFCF